MREIENERERWPTRRGRASSNGSSLQENCPRSRAAPLYACRFVLSYPAKFEGILPEDGKDADKMQQTGPYDQPGLSVFYAGRARRNRPGATVTYPRGDGLGVLVGEGPGDGVGVPPPPPATALFALTRP